MLDKPIYKDWIFYLWLLSIVSIIPGTLASTKNGGGFASFIMGIIFQTLVFLLLPSVIRNKTREKVSIKSSYSNGTALKNASINPNNFSQEKHEFIQVKSCSNCGEVISEMWIMECKKCGGTSFDHEKRQFVPEVPNPEYKKCPMCAEEIKFAAKKCRYCQHMMDEN